MADLLQTSDNIKKTIQGLKNSVRSLEDKQKQSLYAITTDQTARANAEVKQITDSITQSVGEIKAQLDEMSKENLRNAGAPDAHMRSNIHESLKGKFAEVLMQFQRVQTDYKEKVQQKVAQKYKIVKPDATAEEINEVVESGDVNQIFRAQLVDQANLTTQSKNALSYIQSRHQDIVQLDSSIRELHQLFLDMSVMVESQGVILDNVEVNVSHAVADTSAGTDALRAANVAAKKSRKKMIIIIVIIIIIIVVVLSGGIGGALRNRS